MDGQLPLFAGLRRPALRRFALALVGAGLAFGLSGCEADRLAQLDERMTAVEAKAEAADKRAKAAEALASQTQPIVQPDPAPQTDLDGGAEDEGPGIVIENGEEVPQPPMADNGKG